MTAPAGAEVGIHVDLTAMVLVGDVIETQSGGRYVVASVRVQLTGMHHGRQHLRAVVMAPGELPMSGEATVHRIRWYRRGKVRARR